MGRYALILLASNLVESVILWDGVVFDESTGQGYTVPDGYIAIEVSEDSRIGIGWSYIDGEFIAPPEPEIPPPTDEQVSAANISKLQQQILLAATQKDGLADRVGVIQDAIDLEMATPEEVAELPIRSDQLLAWKKYAIYLGRVSLQEGWPLSAKWPEQPETWSQT